MIPDDELQAMRELVNGEMPIDKWRGNAATALAVLPSLLDEIDRLKAVIKQEAVDWAETDTVVREIVRKHLGEEVDGTSDGVPAIADLVHSLSDAAMETHEENCAHWKEIDRLKAENEKLTAELAAKEIRWTDAKPTTAGRYWWLASPDIDLYSPVIHEVIFDDGVAWRMQSDGDRDFMPDWGQWSDKPIPMPEN